MFKFSGHCTVLSLADKSGVGLGDPKQTCLRHSSPRDTKFSRHQLFSDSVTLGPIAKQTGFLLFLLSPVFTSLLVRESARRLPFGPFPELVSKSPWSMASKSTASKAIASTSAKGKARVYLCRPCGSRHAPPTGLSCRLQRQKTARSSVVSSRRSPQTRAATARVGRPRKSIEISPAEVPLPLTDSEDESDFLIPCAQPSRPEVPPTPSMSPPPTRPIPAPRRFPPIPVPQRFLQASLFDPLSVRSPSSVEDGPRSSNGVPDGT